MRTRLLAGLLFCLSCTIVDAQSSNPLVGTWERFSLTNAQGVTQQAGAFVIFSANGYFSQTTVPAKRPKVDKPVQEMTREELLARFQNVQARTGTYTVSGNKLTRKDTTNVNPAQEGTEAVQEFRIEGDVLILTTPGAKNEARFRRVK